MTTTAPLITDAAILRQVVLDAAVGETNPYAVARKVLDQLSTLEEFQAVAEACFPHWVCEQLKRPHQPRAVAPVPVDEAVIPEQVAPKPEQAPLMSGSVRTFTGTDGIPRASRKQAAFIDAYGQVLNKMVKVGDTIERKRLRDCTVDDLLWMADYRRQIAAQIDAEATMYAKLAQAVKDSGAATVAELDRAVGASILLD